LLLDGFLEQLGVVDLGDGVVYGLAPSLFGQVLDVVVDDDRAVVLDLPAALDDVAVELVGAGQQLVDVEGFCFFEDVSFRAADFES